MASNQVPHDAAVRKLNTPCSQMSTEGDNTSTCSHESVHQTKDEDTTKWNGQFKMREETAYEVMSEIRKKDMKMTALEQDNKDLRSILKGETKIGRVMLLDLERVNSENAEMRAFIEAYKMDVNTKMQDMLRTISEQQNKIEELMQENKDITSKTAYYGNNRRADGNSKVVGRENQSASQSSLKSKFQNRDLAEKSKDGLSPLNAKSEVFNRRKAIKAFSAEGIDICKIIQDLRNAYPELFANQQSHLGLDDLYNFLQTEKRGTPKGSIHIVDHNEDFRGLRRQIQCLQDALLWIRTHIVQLRKKDYSKSLDPFLKFYETKIEPLRYNLLFYKCDIENSLHNFELNYVTLHEKLWPIVLSDVEFMVQGITEIKSGRVDVDDERVTMFLRNLYNLVPGFNSIEELKNCNIDELKRKRLISLDANAHNVTASLLEIAKFADDMKRIKDKLTLPRINITGLQDTYYAPEYLASIGMPDDYVQHVILLQKFIMDEKSDEMYIQENLDRYLYKSHEFIEPLKIISLEFWRENDNKKDKAKQRHPEPPTYQPMLPKIAEDDEVARH